MFMIDVDTVNSLVYRFLFFPLNIHLMTNTQKGQIIDH